MPEAFCRSVPHDARAPAPPQPTRRGRRRTTDRAQPERSHPQPCRRRKDMNDRSGATFDLDDLLHPAQAFGHPSEVVNDPDLTLNEKRAILASWASDACAVEAAPELRLNPGGAPVRFDDIMEALRMLDRQMPEARFDRALRRARRDRILRRNRRHDRSD